MFQSEPSPALECSWIHPWLRVCLLVRTIVVTPWDADGWPTAKATLLSAVRLRKEIEQAGWFN